METVGKDDKKTDRRIQKSKNHFTIRKKSDIINQRIFTKRVDIMFEWEYNLSGRQAGRRTD